MCDELGDETYMEEYVLEASGISLCSIGSGQGCSEKELSFASVWTEKNVDDVEKQLNRLLAVSKQSTKTKPELQKWLKQRIAVLKQVLSSKGTAASLDTEL